MDILGFLESVSIYVILILMVITLKKLWESEKKARIDREEKIEKMFNEIMGNNEKWGEKWKIK